MAIEDRVRIRLGKDDLVLCESYDVHMGVMAQPSRFRVRTAHSGVLWKLIEAYPPGTQFQLLVNDVVQFSGRVDGNAVSSTSTLELNGRGKLGELIGVKAQADKVYRHSTYYELLESVLRDAEVQHETVTDPVDDRVAKTGIRGAASREKIVTDVSTKTKKKGKIYIVHPPKIRVGEYFYDFLVNHLNRAGLFLYDSAIRDQLILTQPDGAQKPLYRIFNPARGSGKQEENGSVLDFDWRNDTTDRCSDYVVYGRGGGGKDGRTKTRQRFVDPEMEIYGIVRRGGIKDLHVSSIDEAELRARRLIALGRRRGWSLTYTLAGHTTTALADGQKSIVWARDTVVHVVDRELNIDEDMWIESVDLIGDSKATKTVVHLMRKDDLLFGGDEE